MDKTIRRFRLRFVPRPDDHDIQDEFDGVGRLRTVMMAVRGKNGDGVCGNDGYDSHCTDGEGFHEGSLQL